AKFFIRRGRLSVDGTVVTDPEFDLADTSSVVFDGKSISIAGFQYIVLHKPPRYACAVKDGEHPSVLTLLNSRSDNRYFYFANVLGPDASGLVLLSDDARWTQRVKRRLLKKPRVYRATLKDAINDAQLEQLKDRLQAAGDGKSGTASDVRAHDGDTLTIEMGQTGTQDLLKTCEAVGLTIRALHLQQLGRLTLGDLREGDYAELAEDDVKI
ncbi:MAG: pseudouridine synthase, partial [Pseudomonadota bacterium]